MLTSQSVLSSLTLEELTWLALFPSQNSFVNTVSTTLLLGTQCRSSALPKQSQGCISVSSSDTLTASQLLDFKFRHQH